MPASLGWMDPAVLTGSALKPKIHGFAEPRAFSPQIEETANSSMPAFLAIQNASATESRIEGNTRTYGYSPHT